MDDEGSYYYLLKGVVIFNQRAVIIMNDNFFFSGNSQFQICKEGREKFRIAILLSVKHKIRTRLGQLC